MGCIRNLILWCLNINKGMYCCLVSSELGMFTSYIAHLIGKSICIVENWIKLST